MTSVMTSREKGNLGEAEFSRWMDSSHIAYLALDAQEERMPCCFRNRAKRPDFLLFDRGSIRVAVDVKNKAPIRETTFKIEQKDHVLTSGFEEICGIPVWYVFLVREPPGLNKWFWVRAAGLKPLPDRSTFEVNATAAHLVVEPVDLSTCMKRLDPMAISPKLHTRASDCLTRVPAEAPG